MKGGVQRVTQVLCDYLEVRDICVTTCLLRSQMRG